MMADDGPPCKKAKLSESLYAEFKRVQQVLRQHKDKIDFGIKKLSEQENFCFVKIDASNAAYPQSFSNVFCETSRNVEEEEKSLRKVVAFADLFDVNILKEVLDGASGIEDKIIKSKMLASLRQLADFVQEVKDVTKLLVKQRKSDKKVNWAAVLGIHVFSKLSPINYMRLSDSGYSPCNCPCGCGTPIVCGDTSIGDPSVWHGSVDLLLRSMAFVDTTEPSNANPDENSAFEVKRCNLERGRSQVIAECIVFAFLQNNGLVPTIAISEENVKIYLYDPDSDLLFESTELALMTIYGDLNYSTVLALWQAINYRMFCKGVKPEHEELGYTSNFRENVGEEKLRIYRTKLHFENCKQQRIKPNYTCLSLEGLDFLP